MPTTLRNYQAPSPADNCKRSEPGPFSPLLIASDASHYGRGWAWDLRLCKLFIKLSSIVEKGQYTELSAMFRLLLCWLLGTAMMLAGTAAAWAQSFNIDQDIADSPVVGGGAPSSSFGGAAKSPGYWNAIYGGGPTTPKQLRDLSGQLSNVWMQATGGTGSWGGWNIPGNSGDYALLMNDASRIGGAGPEIDYQFTGLIAGQYLVYTYSASPTGTYANTYVEIEGASIPWQLVTGQMPANQFVEGMTHSVHSVFLDGNLTVKIHGTWPYSFCNGIQIVSVPEPITTISFIAGIAGYCCRRRRRQGE